MLSGGRLADCLQERCQIVLQVEDQNQQQCLVRVTVRREQGHCQVERRVIDLGALARGKLVLLEAEKVVKQEMDP